MQNQIQFGRVDYLAKRCTHREYYAQFVTPEIRSAVLRAFPLKRLRETSDQKNLNSIPLNQWDLLAGGYSTQLCATKLREAGDGCSLASSVCIPKEAAKQLIEESNPSLV